MILKIVPREHLYGKLEIKDFSWIIDNIHEIEKSQIHGELFFGELQTDRLYSMFEDLGGDWEDFSKTKRDFLCLTIRSSIGGDPVRIRLDDTVKAYLMNDNSKTIEHYSL